MSAILRAYGTNFDPDRFCSESGFEPCAMIYQGEPVLPETRPEGRKHERSGIHVVLSDAGFDEFPCQVEETTGFLETHKDELIRLRGFPGVEDVTIDFGIARRDVIVQCDYLPPALVRLAGELGLGIELSHYPIGEDEEDAHDPPHDQS